MSYIERIWSTILVSQTDSQVKEISWPDALTTGLVSDYIFSWDQTSQYYSFVDNLQPGYAYWLYAYQPCVLKRVI